MRKKFCWLIFVSQLVLGLPFIANASPPTIDYQPQSRKVILYQQAAFGVIASGTPPLSYQWFKNSKSIPSATNDQLVIPHVQFADEGLYSVIAFNAEGEMTSMNAELQVLLPKAGDVDGAFMNGEAIDGEISSMQAICIQPDRKILIGGEFIVANDVTRRGIARLNADGSTDPTFMNELSGAINTEFAGARASIESIAVQNDGKVLIVGSFTAFNGVERTNIARLNPDGSLDVDFQSTSLGQVSVVMVQGDQKVLVESSGKVIRLNTDGSVDDSFQYVSLMNEVTSNGRLVTYDGSALVIVEQSDGKILVGGRFNKVNGVDCNYLVRLNSDGTLDSGFQHDLLWNGSSGFIRAIAEDGNGKLLIGGYLNANGEGRGAAVRLNPDGSLDSSFQQTIASEVYSMAVQNDGRVIICGYFTDVNGVSRNKLARLNADGTLDSSFLGGLSGVDAPINSMVYSIALQDDGRILIGGYFDSVNGIRRNNLARLNANGTLDDSFLRRAFRVSVNGPMTVLADDTILASAILGSSNSIARTGIVKLGANGTLNKFLQTNITGSVQNLILQPDGKILIAGPFTAVDGVARTNIARLNCDGSLDSNFQSLVSTLDNWSPKISAIALQDNGKIIIGGVFTTVGSAVHTNLARLNADGSVDNSFLTQIGGGAGYAYNWIEQVVIQPDGKSIIGGVFRGVNDESRGEIARLNSDGSLDSSFQDGFSTAYDAFSSQVNTIALQDDRKVLVGGTFNVIGSTIHYDLIRLNADGTLDGAFQNGFGNGVVSAIKVLSGGEIFVGSGGIFRLNPDGTQKDQFQSSLAPGYKTVSSIQLQSNGGVLIGGYFTILGHSPAVNFARLWQEDFPPVLKNPTQAGGDMNLIWRAISNRTYRVQFSDDLSEGSWMNLPGDISATGDRASKTDTSSSSADQRFYRVLQLP